MLEILVCDPWVENPPKPFEGLPQVRMVDADTALKRADIVAFLVAHRQFQRMDRKLFLSKVVVDAVGLLSRD